MISILHTWGQTMNLHPHLHCIIPGGGLTKDGRWVSTKNKGKYLFSVIAMSKVFRARFIEELEAALPEHVPKELKNELFGKNWVVYAKRPFKSVHSAIEYLGRYTFG
uniref:IS91 family transposase n=1 Tax=Arachidicoccus rhizosphaerae TaxID=551991 RepID=UPI00373FD7A3